MVIYDTPSAQKPTPSFRLDNVTRCDGCGSAFHTAAGCKSISKAKAHYVKKKAAYVNAVAKAKLAKKAVGHADDALKAVQWHWQDEPSTWSKQGKIKFKNKCTFRFALSLNRQTQAKATAMNFHANAKFARQTRLVVPVPQLVPCPPSYRTPPVVPIAHEPLSGEGMTASIGRSASAETDSSSEEGHPAVGDVFTGFHCHIPTAPAGTTWYPVYGVQGSYILEEQEIPPQKAQSFS